MALEEHDREDLVRDGRAFTFRGETICDRETVFVGLRADGRLSLYWGKDRVWQLDLEHAIRRGFWRGRRLTGEADRGLMWLSPRQRGGRMQMERTLFSEVETLAIYLELKAALQQLATHLKQGSQVWHSAFPDVSSAHDRLLPAVTSALLKELPRAFLGHGGLGDDEETDEAG